MFCNRNFTQCSLSFGFVFSKYSLTLFRYRIYISVFVLVFIICVRPYLFSVLFCSLSPSVVNCSLDLLGLVAWYSFTFLLYFYTLTNGGLVYSFLYFLTIVSALLSFACNLVSSQLRETIKTKRFLLWNNQQKLELAIRLLPLLMEAIVSHKLI